MIDDDETDWKVLTIALDDDKAQSLSRNSHSPKQTASKRRKHISQNQFTNGFGCFIEGRRK